MNNKKYSTVLLVFLCIGSLSLVGCTSQLSLLLKESSCRTKHVKKMCEENFSQSPLLLRADSLYTTSLSLIQNGNDEHGYIMMDLAFAYYSLALTKTQALETITRIGELEKKLTTAKNDLVNYQRILAEIQLKPEE